MIRLSTPVGAGVGIVAAGLALAPATSAAATIIEVNEETSRPYDNCAAAWQRLTGAYRQKASGACKDAGGVRRVDAPVTGRKPVGNEFICTIRGRIICNK